MEVQIMGRMGAKNIPNVPQHTNGEGGADTSADNDTQREYTRQKEYLEKTIESLKRKLRKDSEVHRLGNMRIMGGG